jgi:hypothetical protein
VRLFVVQTILTVLKAESFATMAFSYWTANHEGLGKTSSGC